MSTPAPYPADTRAKGWRFELDYQRIEQSATWALAGPEARPWLLMLWLTAWRQTPCGSFEADETVIAARIGMPPKTWPKFRTVLMRGWVKADDGRLYHQTMTELVLEMMAKRRSEADRKAAQRAKNPPSPPAPPEPTETPVPPAPKPPPSPASHADVPRDNDVTPDGRRHVPRTTEDGEIPTPPQSTPPVVTPQARAMRPEVEICIALRRAGFPTANPDHPTLAMLVAAGATVEEFTSCAGRALKTGDPFAYVLAVVQGRRTEAAKAAAQVHHGPLPERPLTAGEQRMLEAVPNLVSESVKRRAAAQNATKENPNAPPPARALG